MSNLPLYVSSIFILTVFLTVLIFYIAARKSKKTLIVLLGWLLVQGLISITGFYKATDSIPPRFSLLVLPPLIIIGILFLTANGKKYIDGLNIKMLTILHIIRIPVEIVLLWLSIYKLIPEIMTFQGRNFDVAAGLTAPLVFYFGFQKNKISSITILLWNILCIVLLLIIVSIAVLSAPFPFQQLGFNQPNIALLYFPYIWLPCCIVPLVLFSHLASIRQLLNRERSPKKIGI
jgi:hypothetical protein